MNEEYTKENIENAFSEGYKLGTEHEGTRQENVRRFLRTISFIVEKRNEEENKIGGVKDST